MKIKLIRLTLVVLGFFIFVPFSFSCEQDCSLYDKSDYHIEVNETGVTSNSYSINSIDESNPEKLNKIKEDLGLDEGAFEAFVFWMLVDTHNKFIDIVKVLIYFFLFLVTIVTAVLSIWMWRLSMAIGMIYGVFFFG